MPRQQLRRPAAGRSAALARPVVVRWIALMLGAAVTSMAVGFVVGLARPRRAALPPSGSARG